MGFHITIRLIYLFKENSLTEGTLYRTFCHLRLASQQPLGLKANKMMVEVSERTLDSLA